MGFCYRSNGGFTAQVQLPVIAGGQQQAQGIGERHVIDPWAIGRWRLFFGDDQQHRGRAFAQQAGGFHYALFETVAGSSQGGHFTGFATHDRPQADDRVVYRQAELGWRQRLLIGQVAEDFEGARGFAMPGNEHQRQILQTFGQWPAHGKSHARQAA
ncbi:hypothetical protein D3C80_1212320 [compost metagenome]